MLRVTPFSLGKQVRTKGKIALMGKLGAQSKGTQIRLREITKDDASGELIAGPGMRMKKSTGQLQETFNQFEYPLIWIYYPWRKGPEPPVGSPLPCPNALKNLHGAVVNSLTSTEQSRQREYEQGFRIPDSREKAHAAKHPFLHNIFKKTVNVRDDPQTGLPVVANAVGFPFWYKMYPTRQHAYEYRFNIPKEMVLAYPKDMQAALSSTNMAKGEKGRAEKARYIEKYQEHDLDTTSPAVVCSVIALRARSLRNHLLVNPHNNIVKFALAKTELALSRNLKRLRKIDFKKYWQIINDHDVQDLIQPNNKVSYRWGKYWRHDWDSGVGLATNIADFMDPRGMSGCVETGRSRAEVARDLGLSYTRALMPNEKRHLQNCAVYRERLQRLKVENPEQWRLKGRQEFIKKFTGLFVKVNWKSRVVDFPSRFRGIVGSKLTRWKSARHGPQ